MNSFVLLFLFFGQFSILQSFSFRPIARQGTCSTHSIICNFQRIVMSDSSDKTNLSNLATNRPSDNKKQENSINSFLKSFFSNLKNKAFKRSNNNDDRKFGRVSRFITLISNYLRNPRFMLQTSIVLVAFFVFFKRLVHNYRNFQEISYANFLMLLTNAPDRISKISISPSAVHCFIDGKYTVSRIVNVDRNVMSMLIKSGLDFCAIRPPANVMALVWSGIYFYFLWIMFSRMQGPKDESVGKTRNQLMSLNNLGFDDIAGQDKAKYEVKEVVDMLRNPQAFAKLGARLPSGILLTGPPGTGKTLLARVIAAESKVPFFACSATDFMEVFVGRGPARMRKLFRSAASQRPSIVFIDELDSIGRSRRSGSLNSEQENTLNQLLTCMDGLDTSNNGVFVIAATNRPELLDEALLRPGRFDRIVSCPLPDKDGRLAILNVHTRKLTIDSNVNLDVVASLTNGLGGADLASIVNEAAIRAVRRNGEFVSQQDFYDSMQAFFSSRGMTGSISKITEVASDWFKRFGINSSAVTSPI